MYTNHKAGRKVRESRSERRLPTVEPATGLRRRRRSTQDRPRKQRREDESITAKAAQNGSLGRHQTAEEANGRKTDVCTYGVDTRVSRFQGRWQVVIDYADLVRGSYAYARSIFSERLSENLRVYRERSKDTKYGSARYSSTDQVLRVKGGSRRGGKKHKETRA